MTSKEKAEELAMKFDMILTGKSLDNFLNWYWSTWFSDKERVYYNGINEAIEALTKTDKVFLHSIIIEWFDSVGYFIEIVFMDNNIWNFNIHDDGIDVGLCERTYNNRQETTKQAILKAKDIYNEKTAI